MLHISLSDRLLNNWGLMTYLRAESIISLIHEKTSRNERLTLSSKCCKFCGTGFVDVMARAYITFEAVRRDAELPTQNEAVLD